MTIHTPTPDGGRIVEEPMGEALSRRYLAYALSTITNRALPDVRDGFKPVHRRIMYAMHQMRLNPQAAARKCAKVVGEVMGGYHPHGDASIYEALVRLAQDFAQRYPLVDGQGNFGNIDGDSAAAMRYTECKLTPAAVLLLDGIDQDAVDFRPTYDDQDEEPVVLPAGFPNLLANGSSGIAVGMATSIPPHNVGELIDACQLLLERPDATTVDLMQIVPGPDFPTGGVSVESQAAILDAYETGRGGVRLRAKWVEEKLDRGAYQIVITEMPYQVQKSRLIEALADLIENKKAPLLGDVRDESAEDIRLILEPKNRTIEPEMLMESLFKLSDLEVRFPINMNVLDATGTPRVMGLKECLRAFLDHRRVVLNRRSQWRIARVEKRLHLLEGLRIVFLNLDEVIRIVREEEQPKAALIATFGLSELQADFILDTRLRQLARLEEMTIEKRIQGAVGRTCCVAGADVFRGQAVEGDRQGTGGRAQGADLAAPHLDRRSGRRLGLRRARGLHSARGHYCHPVGSRLDPRRQGQGRRSLRAEVQGRRQAGLPDPRLYDGQAADRGLGRAHLHHRRRQAGFRARPRRAVAPDDRPGREGRHHQRRGA